MQSFSRLLMTVLALLLIATIPTARSQEVTVGDIDFPERVWGYQTIEFEVFNNSDEWKYLIVETDAVFEGTYLNPRRLHYKNFISEPNSKQVLRPEVEIPANYGVVTVWVRIHDVVDTLDDISFGEQVFEQPFRLRFHVADGALPYLQEKITLPPMVEYAGVLDNEFSRLLLVMLSEGKTIAEIAKLTGTDEAFVRSAADQMVAEHYLKDNGDGYALAVPVITQAEAEEARKLAEETSEKLADLIRKNQQSCQLLIDSLIQAGALSADKTYFYGGGTVLYRPYPLIAGMVVWDEMGRNFITGGPRLDIFGGRSPCKARIGQYMYVVQGGDYFNGSHYYDNRAGKMIYFGDTVPSVRCKPGYKKKRRLTEGVDWWYNEEFKPEPFYCDTTLINPALRACSDGALGIFGPVLKSLQEIHHKYGFDDFPAGVRYWFWNLTATLTVNKLVESGVVEREGNGQFNYQKKV